MLSQGTHTKPHLHVALPVVGAVSLWPSARELNVEVKNLSRKRRSIHRNVQVMLQLVEVSLLLTERELGWMQQALGGWVKGCWRLAAGNWRLAVGSGPVMLCSWSAFLGISQPSPLWHDDHEVHVRWGSAEYS